MRVIIVLIYSLLVTLSCFCDFDFVNGVSYQKLIHLLKNNLSHGTFFPCDDIWESECDEVGNMLYVIEFAILSSLFFIFSAVVYSIYKIYRYYKNDYLYELFGSYNGRICCKFCDITNGTLGNTVTMGFIWLSYVATIISIIMFVIIISKISDYNELDYCLGSYLLCSGFFLALINLITLPCCGRCGCNKTNKEFIEIN